MGTTQKTTPDNYFSLNEWTWQGTPFSVTIIERETFRLLYTIRPINQENLVLASHWVKDHNKLISLIKHLQEGLDNQDLNRAIGLWEEDMREPPSDTVPD